MVLNILPRRNIGEVVIQVSMASLVCSYCSQHVSNFVIARWKHVVLYCVARSWHVRPGWKSTFINCLKQESVSVYSLLFQVANPAVTPSWPEQIHQEIPIRNTYLRESKHNSERNSRVTHGQKQEEVHSLILGLLEEVMDPTVISLKCSETSHVSLHRTHHARYSGDRFQENDSVKPRSFIITRLWVESS